MSGSDSSRGSARPRYLRGLALAALLTPVVGDSDEPGAPARRDGGDAFNALPIAAFLRGGCRGQAGGDGSTAASGGSGGPAGGAVLLAASGDVTVAAGAVVNAGGAAEAEAAPR
jgi:hypothetical protein